VPPDTSAAEGICSLEVRWIFPGQLKTGVGGWFGRFPAGMEARQDSYLLDPSLRGLSVKVRAGGALEVKAYHGSPGILDVRDRACGRMQSWQKWSFPVCPLGQGSVDLAGWKPVAKKRRISRFSLAGGRVVAGAPVLAGQPACAVELTEVGMLGEAWWSLGLEATGPAGLLRGALEATAAFVFAQTVPVGVEPCLDNSRSYAEWLGQRLGAVVTPVPERRYVPARPETIRVLQRRQGGPMGIKAVAARTTGPPSRLRSFDPARVADLEYRAWVGYYRHNWYQALTAFAGLIRLGFGMDWCRILHAAWLVLRAIQLWAPRPDNDPDGARACMRRFYALVRLSYGVPASPAKAAELEVDWWRVHRQVQYSMVPGVTEDDLVESVTRLYCYLFGSPRAEVRPAAVHRVRAMSLSDQWVREGCLPDSPLLPLMRAALVRVYAALLAAIHH
jgi:hypothetical protein